MNLRKNLASYIALNNYVSAYRTNITVPTEYTQVEYVFCNPTSSTEDADMPYFTTSWKPDLTKNIKIVGRTEYCGTGTYRPLILGNYKSSYSSALSVELRSGAFMLYSMSGSAGSGHQFTTGSFTKDDVIDFNVQITGNTGASTISTTSNGTTTTNTGTVDAAGEVCDLDMRLFRDYRVVTPLPSGYKTPIKVYSLKATENDVVVLDLVPVIRKSDNSIGFYDLATDTFLANEGSADSNSVLEAGSVIESNRLELKDAVSKPFESLSAYGYTEQLSEEYLDTVTAKGKCEIKKEYQTLVANGGTKQSQQTLQAKGKCGFVCVPSEYTQVESITTDGTSYINTGIEYTNYTGFDLDFKMENTSTGIILGASNSSINFNLSYSGSLNYGTSTSGVISNNTSRQRASMINQKITKSDGTTTTITQPVVGGYAKNIYLGGINYYGTFADGKSITIYAVRLYVKDKVVFDGVPARKDYTYGLYDTISGKFITNAGSGTISGGDDVFDPLPAGYTRVEYVENYSEENKNNTNPLVKTNVAIVENDNFKMDIESSITYNSDTSTDSSNSFYLMQSRQSNNSTITGVSGQGAQTANTIIGAPGTSDGINLVSGITRLNKHGHKAQYIFECKNGDMWLYVKDITAGQSDLQTGTYDPTTTSARATKPLCIFGNDSIGSGIASSNRLASGCKMYHVRVWKNDILALDYVPAIRNSDGEVGFYDRVTDTFVTKAYTQGSLLAGPISTSPKEIRCNNGVIEKDATSANKYKITPTVKETLVDFPDTEYTVLDYVENLQTGSLNTGIVPGNGILKIDYNFQNVSNDTTQRGIIAAGTTYDQPGTAIQLAMYINDRSETPTYGEYTFYNLEPGETMNPFQLVTNNRMAGSWTINGSNGTNVFTGSLQDSVTSTAQFGNDTVWRSQSIKCSTNGVRIYSLKIYVDNVLVGDFEPRRRNSDGILGLYNKVNNTFIASEKVDYPYSIACENLLSIPNTEYFDTQDILQGIKTKRIGVKVFDGTEPDSDFDVKTNWYEYVITPNLPVQFHSSSDVRTVLCTHFDGTYVESPNHVYSTSSYGNQALTFRVTSTYATLADFKSFLASEYAAGRPVIVLYPIYHVGSQETIPVSKPETLPENNVTLVKGALQDLELNKYEELEYITATGTQWIDTGILAASDIKAEVKFKPTTNDSTYSVLGGRDGERVNTFTIFTRVSGGTIRLDYGNNQSPVSQTQSVSTENWNFITKDGANNYFNGSAISNNSADTFASTTNSIYLFTLNNNGTSTYPFIGSIAYCKLYKNGVMVRNFIPAKRKSDNEVGMYDKVSGQFFTNIGTGTFTAGTSKTSWVGNPNNPADIWTNNGIIYALPSGYTQLEYLQGDGASYIDTGIYSSNLTRTEVVVKASTTSSPLPVFGDFQAVGSEIGASNTLYYVNGNAGFYTTDKGGSNITGDTNKTKLGNYDSSNFHNITVDLKNRKGIFDGTETALVNTTTWTSQRTQLLFARRASDGSIGLYSACQIKSCKIYEDDTLVRNLIPAKRNTDDEIGMYDLVTKTFYTNSGTGSFTAGPTVYYYISGTQEQIEVEGNNLIDFDISVMAIGYYNNTENKWRVGTNWGYAVSAPIEVIPGKTYRYSFTKQIAHDTSDNCVIGYSTLTAAQNDIVNNSATQGTKLVVCPSSGTTFGKQYGDYSYDITIPSDINYVRVTSIFENMDGPDNLYRETSTSDKNTNFRRVDISRPENLLSVSETYTDTQYIKEGKKYAKCGIKVLTGNETYNVPYSFYIHIDSCNTYITLGDAQSMQMQNSIGSCTHLKLANKTIWSLTEGYPNTFVFNGKQLHLNFAHDVIGTTESSTTGEALAAIKSYITAQYNAGTPIIIVYPLATAEETNTPAIDLQKNPISVEVVKASLESESLPLTYNEVFDTSDPTPTEPKDIWCNNGVINGLYSELDYITTTGTQYIQTTISGPARWVGSGQGTSNANGSKVILSAQATTGGAIQGAVIWIGSRLGSTDAGKYWTLGGSVSTGLSTSTVPTLDYAEYDVSFNNEALTGKVNDFTFNTVNIHWDIGVWRIGTSFTNDTGNPNYYFVGNIYRQTAYQNGVVVGDFIPVIRNSDNVVGMYDAVSGTFLTNAGTGTFTAGNIKNYFVVGTVEKLVDNIGNEAQCELLLKSANGNAFEDIQEIISGNVTRNCAIKVFDGSENESWSTSSWTGTNTIVYYLTDSNIKHDSSLYSSTITLCTHYKSYSRDYLNTNDVEGSGISGLTTNTAFTFRVSRTDFPDVTAWKTWLAAQYAAGTPVMMVYPIKTATSETVSKQILRKDPVTVQEASLEDLVVDTTKSIHTTPNPDFPLSIQNNNGTMKVMDKSSWIQIKGTTGSYGVYINPTSGINYQKWYRTTDRGCGLVIPLTVGKAYTLIIGNTTSETGTYLRFGQSNTGPNVPTSASTGEVLLDCHLLDYSKNVYHNFIAQRPYLVMQIQPGGSGTASPTYDYVVNDLLVMLEEDTVEQLVYTGKNLNDVSTDTTGSYINQDGEIISDDNSCYSDIIPVVAGQTYTWSGICGGLSYNNKRVHAYIDGVWKQPDGQIAHEQITAGDPFSITFTVPVGVNGIRISHFISDTETQVEEGARPTHYESYIQTKLPVDDLYSVSSDYTDVKNIITGNVTRKCGVLVLTGEENWLEGSDTSLSLSKSSIGSNSTVLPSNSTTMICTHYPVLATSAVENAIWVGASNVNFRVRVAYPTIASWKSYLKKKYQEGDPIIIIYPLGTSTTETSIANQLSTNTSTNTVERISSTTNNLGISANYKKLK